MDPGLRRDDVGLVRQGAAVPKRTDIRQHPDHRRRADRDRAGVRIRLFRGAGVQGVEGRGLPDRAGQFEPGDDHDRPGTGRRHLYRADHPGHRRADHRPRAAPIALLPTMGGQTALNTAMALARSGVARALRGRADRRQRRGDRQGRGPPAVPPGDGPDRPRIAEKPARRLARRGDWRRCATVGLPAIIRPSFTLGGTGGGIAYNTEEFEEIVRGGLRASPTPRGADRGIGARLEGVRARDRARPQRQLHRHLLDREHRPDGRPHRRFGDASRRH